MAACSLYLAKNDTNSGFVLRHVRLRAKELLSNPSPCTPLEILSRAQALLLYQIILVFDGDVRLSWSLPCALTANEVIRYLHVYRLKSQSPSWRHMHSQSNRFSTRKKRSSLPHFRCILLVLQTLPGKIGSSANQHGELSSFVISFSPSITHSKAMVHIATIIQRLPVNGLRQRICGMRLRCLILPPPGMRGDILLYGTWIICLCFWMGIRVRWIALGGLSSLRR